MATRNKTSVFLRYRDSHHSHRAVLPAHPSEAAHDPRTMRRNLLSGEDGSGSGSGGGADGAGHGHGALAFEDASAIWSEAAADCRELISRIRQETSELRRAQQRALRNIVAMEDDAAEEQVVEIKTQLVTQLFGKCQRIIKEIDNAPNPHGREVSGAQHAALRKNVVRQLAGEVAEQSRAFRKMQQEYMHKVREQDKFEDKGGAPGASSSSSAAAPAIDIDDIMGGGGGPPDRGFTDRQLLEVEHTSALIEEREHAIKEIQRSVEELATMMKELMTLVIDQGTIVDRIDYQVEEMAQHVEKGLSELQKASDHQKSARYKLCIILLIVLIALLGSVIMFKKLLGHKK
jgi:syntaxin 16